MDCTGFVLRTLSANIDFLHILTPNHTTTHDDYCDTTFDQQRNNNQCTVAGSSAIEWSAFIMGYALSYERLLISGKNRFRSKWDI